MPVASGGITKTGTQRDGLTHSSDRSRTDDYNSSQTSGSRDEHANGDSAGTSSSTYNRSGTFTRASSDSTSSVGQDDALSQAYSHEQRAQKLHELSQALTRDANYAESHSLQMSENLSQELAQWYAGERSSKLGLNAPELHQTTFTDQERITRDGMIAQFLTQRRQAIYNEVAPQLHEPDLVKVAAPPVSTDADVTARYHPHGLSALPSAPAMPDGSAARDRVSSGKDTLAAEQEAQGVMRSGAVQAGSQVQSDVNKDL
ncbi:MAG: conjugal transfer protein TraG, partial [Oxalobacteraceae bacterium]